MKRSITKIIKANDIKIDFEWGKKNPIWKVFENGELILIALSFHSANRAVFDLVNNYRKRIKERKDD